MTIETEGEVLSSQNASIDMRGRHVKFKIDIAKHNAQYAPIDLVPFDRAHDRFLCIDDTVYHIGASLKDLGKKWFAFNRMELTTDELLSKI